ncbi:MAG: hypothetical protein FJ398_00135 [Verrucomicrobia bacterium]|nr:hypothetical protein [Verrucomicrobiota bacterium]
MKKTARLKPPWTHGHQWDSIVFGSQCILGMVARPPGVCLRSQEVDLYPRANPQALPLLVTQLGARSDFSRQNGFFVDCVTPELASLPDGWTERLIPFRTKRTGGVTGWCLELHDLAASKLAAGREKDRSYLEALLRSRLIKPMILADRIATLPVSSGRRKALTTLFRQMVRQVRQGRTSISKRRRKHVARP